MNIVVLFGLCSLVWGSTWYAITFQVGTVDSLWSVFYRFVLASMLMFGYCWWSGKKYRFTFVQHIRMIWQGACLCGISYWLVYEAERYISSGLTAVLSTTILYFNVLIARLWLKNPVKARVMAGGLLGSLGVSLVMLPEFGFSDFDYVLYKGTLLTLLGSLFISIGCVACERNAQEGLPMLPVVSLNMFYGSAVVAVIALACGKMPTFDVSEQYILSLLYLVVFGSIGALTSYVTLIRRIGADRAAFVDVVYPVVALCLSTVMEGYQWTLVALCGVALISIGNLIGLKPQEAEQHPQSTLE